MRISSYTEQFYFNDKSVIISLITGAIVQFENCIHPLKIESKEGNDYNDLLKNGIFTNLSVGDEKIYANKLFKRIWETASNGKSIVVMPTLNCNLKCSYCYQSSIRSLHKGNTLSQNEVKVIIDYMKDHNVDSICLYGGEPLLKANISVLKPILDLIIENNGTVHATTNGTQLHYFKKYLGEHCIANLQITLDGDEESHNKLRKYHNGKGSWNMIISNIDVAVSCGSNVSIRMNANSENLESCKNLRDKIIEKYKDSNSVSCYIAVITGELGDLSYQSDYSDSLSHPCFAKFSTTTGNAFYPSGSFCTTTSKDGGKVFGPGGIWNCWRNAGELDSVVASYSDVMNGTIEDKVKISNLPQFSETCQSCRYLFLCAGECYANKHECDMLTKIEYYRNNLEEQANNFINNFNLGVAI